MSINVTPAMQVQYKNNSELALQQTKAPILEAITLQGDVSAEKIKIRDIVGNTQAQEINERHGDTKYNNPTYDGVWLAKPNPLTYADIIDTADKLGTSIDLQGTSVLTGAGTIARAWTQRVLEGFYGNIVSGKDGTTTTAFPGGQTLAVTLGGAAGNQKMNVAKIRAANKLLAQGYVDLNQQRFMVLTADDNDALLQEIPVTSADFMGSYRGKVDDSGRVTGLLGWTFLYEELDNPLLGTVPALATDGSGFRKTPFWVRPGVVANIWERNFTSIDQLPGKNVSVQVYNRTTVAATRTQAGMSGIILNLKG